MAELVAWMLNPPNKWLGKDRINVSQAARDVQIYTGHSGLLNNNLLPTTPKPPSRGEDMTSCRHTPDCSQPRTEYEVHFLLGFIPSPFYAYVVVDAPQMLNPRWQDLDR